ncbi:crossover junction endonuclease MUS81 isoform X3 [Engraulis encrasicolus]|uniref:crossover junction endonuclease MUS81 isoform X3 n=1 Tax=Engraulis encrasicolus TaxID=184585 RepID=UPI002FCFD951
MPPEAVRLGRKRTLPSCPNPLFLQWLTELRDQAVEKGKNSHFVYQKAIHSLKKYPLPLMSGKEANILQNFGPGICKILDKRLEQYYQDNGPDAPIHSLPSGVKHYVPDSNNLESSKASTSAKELSGSSGGQNKSRPKKAAEPKKARGGPKKRNYVPQKGSGGYAVLLTLYRHSQVPGNNGFMFKNELMVDAQPLCLKSFTVPDLGSKYTAWSSVSTLTKRELVLKTHSPARYCLTELGQTVAEQLESEEREEVNEEEEEEEEEENEAGKAVNHPEMVDLTQDDRDNASDHDDDANDERQKAAGSALATRPPPVICVNEEVDDWNELQASEQEAAASGILLPGCYDIVLCVDFIETTGGNTVRKQELVTELQKNRVTFDIRKLNVGDFLWIARERTVDSDAGQARPPAVRELVLDYIVERKRMDDLCGSIIDGRFREQKFRLKRCGLHKPIYLVEEHGSAAAHLSLPESTLQQAIVNTQVVDGFFVKRVQDVKESAAYLTMMTRYLQKLYQNRTLHCRSRELEGDGPKGDNVSCSLISFTEFNHGAVKSKSQTVREVFARQLMQISGLSGDKAAAILEHYSCVNSLMEAYARCSSEAEKDKLLSSIRYGKLKRNLGPSLSHSVYQLYCTKGPLS